MAILAVRCTLSLLARNRAGFLVIAPVESVLIRQGGVACDVFADNDMTPLAEVPIGVDPGEVGVDDNGDLVVYLAPGRGYDAVATIAGDEQVFAIPDVPLDAAEPIPAGAVEEAMLSFGVATQAELDSTNDDLSAAVAATAALASATDTALDAVDAALAGKQPTIPPGTYVGGVIVAGAGIDDTGATDSTAAINTKIADASEVGIAAGRMVRVRFPDGTYITDGIVAKPYTWLDFGGAVFKKRVDGTTVVGAALQGRAT